MASGAGKAAIEWPHFRGQRW